MTRNPEQAHNKALADELHLAARQASAAAGSFTRWAVYLETDPAAAIERMRKVLTTGPAAKNPSPFLPLLAEKILSEIDPASIEYCRQRRATLDRERAEYCSQGQQYREEWEQKQAQEKAELVQQVAEAKAGRISGEEGNVVSVKFGGAT